MNRRSIARHRTTSSVFRRALLLAIIGAVCAFGVADANPVFLILTLMGVLVSWFASVRPARPAPRGLINTILLLVIAIAGYEMLRVGVGVSAFAVFVALLLVVKLLDLRSARDDGQVIVLCLAILVAAVLTSNSLLTGAMMIVESVLILRAVVLFQIHSVGSLGHLSSPRISKGARIDIRSMMIATGFLCAIIGSTVFVVLPRNLGGQAFGQWGNTRSVSGFSDKVELGRPGLISMSSKPVLDVTITDRNGMNVGAENNPPVYLRGAVLEVYESGNWRRSSIMRVPLAERIRLFPPSTTLKPRGSNDNSGWDQQFAITMRSTSDGPVYLFAPWRTVEFRIGDMPMRMGFDFGRGLFLKDGMGGSISYTVRSVNDEFRSVPIADDAFRAQTIETEIEPEIAQLAREIIAGGGIEPDPASRPIRDDAAAVRLLETHLRTQYKYTLDAQPVPSGQDATRWFLFERKTGHCEYYASALTLMSRSVGIPARVVTGYIASDFNAVTGQYLVRESNAHAWVEAEVAPGQWRTFDGTPPSDFYSIHVPQPSLMRSLSKMYESIEFLWVRSVVGYDSDTRERIVGNGMGDFGLARMGDKLLSRLAAGRAKLVSRATVFAVIVFVSTMFVGIVILRYQKVVLILLHAWRSLLARLGIGLRARISSERSVHRVETAINTALRRTGLPRPEWQPLKAHLRSNEQQLQQTPELAQALHDAADWLYRFRFAPGNHEEQYHRLRGFIEAIRKSEKSADRQSPHPRGRSERT